MAIVAEYDWESDTFTQHGDENAARKAWREAVAAIAEKAKATLPECNGRVDRAVQIVLNHDVELLDDGKAKVASQSSGKVVYHLVNGGCECRDYTDGKAPSGWCKHRIAAGLYKRATALIQRQLHSASNGQASVAAPAQLSAQDAALAQPVASVAAPAQLSAQDAALAQPVVSVAAPAHVAPLPEAPVSITLKATLHGHEVLVTLRGTDFASVKVHVEEASAWLQAQALAQPPTQSGDQAESWCSKHGVAMKLQHGKNGSGTWYSHKTAAGWCKG
jgi:hypothetical protein